MNYLRGIPDLGMLETDYHPQVHQWWLEAMKLMGKDTTGFEPDAPLSKRIAWCRERDIQIDSGYGRFSTKMQKSDLDQARAIVQMSAAKGFYLPPEFISIDRGRTGKANRRPGLVRNTSILGLDAVSAMVFNSQSRVYRRSYESIRYIREEVVDQGKRAFSVHGGLDTNHGSWKLLLPIQGTIDEDQLDSTAAAVVNGHLGLFYQGYSIGPIPVGYEAVEVPGAPMTRLGRPRTKLGVNGKVAELIRQCFVWVADSVPLAECVRRYNDTLAALPESERLQYLDPRSNKRIMTPSAFRKMLENVLYKGLRTYGKTASRWNAKADYMMQEKRPGGPLARQQCEELRIVDDDLFDRVQARLAAEHRGNHGIWKNTDPRALHHRVAGTFFCSYCGHRLYSTRVRSARLRCPNIECRIPINIKAEEAVHGVLAKVKELFFNNTALVDELVRWTEAMAVRENNEEFERQLSAAERRLKTASNRFFTVVRTIGADTPEKMLSQLKRECAEAQAEVSSLKKLLASAQQEKLDAGRIRNELLRFEQLLDEAASGKLGKDLTHEAAGIFHMLVGGRIEVYREERPGKTRTSMRGRFTPTPVLTLDGDLRTEIPLASLPFTREPVSVYLRPPPRADQMADTVYRLHGVEKLSFAAIRDKLKLSDGLVYHAWQRWHEMRGLEVPDESHLRRGRPGKRVLAALNGQTPQPPVKDSTSPASPNLKEVQTDSA